MTGHLYWLPTGWGKARFNSPNDQNEVPKHHQLILDDSRSIQSLLQRLGGNRCLVLRIVFSSFGALSSHADIERALVDARILKIGDEWTRRAFTKPSPSPSVSHCPLSRRFHNTTCRQSHTTTICCLLCVRVPISGPEVFSRYRKRGASSASVNVGGLIGK